MKKDTVKTKKISFKKFQISKINNSQFIFGGTSSEDDDPDDDEGGPKTLPVK